MLNKINLNLKDIIIFFVSIILFLFIFSQEKKEYYSRVIVYFPKFPSIYFDADKNMRFSITLEADKVYMPAFSKTLSAMEHDSRITKLHSICKDTQLLNLSRNYGYITFTMRAQDPKPLENCYEQIKINYDKEWQIEKKKSIYYLDKATKSISNFSYFFYDYAQKNFKDIFKHEILKIEGCYNYWKVDNVYKGIKKLYYDICGNYHPLILTDHSTNEEVPISDEFSLKLYNNLTKKRGFQTPKLKEGKVLFPIYLNESDDLNILFDKKNINKELGIIVNLLGDKEYLLEDLDIGLEKDYVFHYEPRMDGKKAFDIALHINRVPEYFEVFFDSSYNKIEEVIDSYTKDIFLKTNKQIFVPKEFENSKIVYAKSENYNLSTTKSFTSIRLIFSSIVCALFIMFFQKLTFNFIKSKLHEKNQ